MNRFCRVVVDSRVKALDREFDYAIPDRFEGRVFVGSVVRVPLHGRRVRAFVTELLAKPAVPEPKLLSALVSAEPVFRSSEVRLARWISLRYLTPLAGVLHQGVPGRFSAPGQFRDLLELSGTGFSLTVAVTARDELEAVRSFLGDNPGLVICPRPWIATQLAQAIPGAAVLHGGLSPAQRASVWASARDGRLKTVIGTRSALLCPVRNLGSIAIVGAHDRAHKSARAPRLHSLPVCIRRAELSQIPMLVTSPVPPLELTQNEAEWKSSKSSTLKPEVVGLSATSPVTPRLLDCVRSALACGKDAFVFMARKGSALRLRCADCGWYPRCPECGIALTLFDVLKCRSCGSEKGLPTVCEDCAGSRILKSGWGSTRLAKALAREIPEAPIIHVDASTDFESPAQPAVIVGTEAGLWSLMPGHKKIGAVVAADLDQLLGLPDFRAAEHSFATLEELGRLVDPDGRMLVQTRESSHHSVQAFTRRSYKWFTDRELPIRRAAGYPPFGAIVAVTTLPDEVRELQRCVESAGASWAGPLPGPGGRVKGLIKARSLEQILPELRQFSKTSTQTRFDVDPTDVL